MGPRIHRGSGRSAHSGPLVRSSVGFFIRICPHPLPNYVVRPSSSVMIGSQTWIMDPVELPPNAVLNAPFVGGKPIVSWLQLASASKKERNLIIKMSGFHEHAWGARSVVLGSDSSRADWRDAIEKAIVMSYIDNLIDWIGFCDF